ncbi:MAG: DegT/DnrJ/EryC1/StrS family aminotransferase [Microgenomates group bacterium]
MRVPYLNLRQNYHGIEDALVRSFTRVLQSGRVILGPEVQTFEKQYATFSKTKYCVGVANGLDALILSLSALGIGKNDEVIVPSNTYIATLVAVSRVGATPILVEPKINTYNIDPKNIAAAITKKTKVIIPVHLFGQACQMDEIMRIANKHHLFIVEDNAQSHGATFNKKMTGSFGDVNATSFYPGKNLGAIGDAGAITTGNQRLANIIRSIRNYGESKRYVNEYIGFNSRLDELQAAILRVRLSHLATYTKQKQRIAKKYTAELAGVGDIILPITETGSTHVYHVYLIRTNKRNALQKYLESKSITTLIHYPIPPHLQAAYKELHFKKGSFPIAEELAATSLSLPIFPDMTNNQVEYVVKMIKQFFQN